MYQWANMLGLDDEFSPLEAVAYDYFAKRADGPTELLDIFSRKRTSRAVFTPRRMALWGAEATRRRLRGGEPLLPTLRRDAGRELDKARELATFTRTRARSRDLPPAAPLPEAAEELRAPVGVDAVR